LRSASGGATGVDGGWVMPLLLRRTPFDRVLFAPGAGANAKVRGVIILAAAAIAPLSLPSLQGVGASAFAGLGLASLASLATLTAGFAYWLLTEHAKSGYAPVAARFKPCAVSFLVLTLAVFASFALFSDALPGESAGGVTIEAVLKSLVMVEASIIACLLVTPLWEPKEADLGEVAEPAAALATHLSPIIRERVESFDDARAYEAKWKRLADLLDAALDEMLMTNPAIDKGPSYRAWEQAAKEMRETTISTGDYLTRTSGEYRTWAKAADAAVKAVSGQA
jgi:hypothetical protein